MLLEEPNNFKVIRQHFARFSTGSFFGADQLKSKTLNRNMKIAYYAQKLRGSFKELFMKEGILTGSALYILVRVFH